MKKKKVLYHETELEIEIKRKQDWTWKKWFWKLKADENKRKGKEMQTREIFKGIHIKTKQCVSNTPRAMSTVYKLAVFAGFCCFCFAGFMFLICIEKHGKVISSVKFKVIFCCYIFHLKVQNNIYPNNFRTVFRFLVSIWRHRILHFKW